jgi:predicted kinase
MLIILGGLPSVGKTTISRKLAEAIGAIHLRIDTIETAITNSNLMVEKPGNAGYFVAYGLAKDNLLIGHTVIADSVNPIKLTREAWRDVAKLASTEFVEIEIICSDIKEHQRRAETRTADIEGHTLPTWEEIISRKYEDWDIQGITLDTAISTIDESINKIMRLLSQFL